MSQRHDWGSLSDEERLAMVRRYRQSDDHWIEIAWEVLDAATVTTHNSDGDELEGCWLCNPERPFTHREGCPVPRIEKKLNLRKTR